MIIETRSTASSRSKWIERGRTDDRLCYLGYDSDTLRNVVVFEIDNPEVRYRVSLTGNDIERAYGYMLDKANESGVAFRRSLRRMVAGDIFS